jgi:PAS domain S-box-containing protein
MDADTLLLRHAQQTTENAVLLFDHRAVITWCNSTAARIFGYTPAELPGLPARRLFTPEDAQQGIPAYEFEVAANSSRDMRNDRWMLRADGSRFWATGSTTGLRDDGGELIGYAKILRDSTDIKEQLETLRHRAEELVQSDEHKNLFLFTLSHELRNPLAPLANALQLIRMSLPPEPKLEYPIKLIERQVDVISRLVDDLLDVTRISSGRLQLELEPLDLREIIARALESAQPVIEQHKHRLIQHILPGPIIVDVDGGRLEQVFVNLLTNAAKYTPDGGSIEVRSSKDESEAWVRIADSGIGISSEVLPHVFELFTRGDRAAQEAKEGLGIGLALVKRFVEVHGGSVQVRSEGPGKGSEFTVRLPLASKGRQR